MFPEKIQFIFLVSSTLLVIVSMARYIYSIIQWTTKPNLVGWALYQIATICVLLSALDLWSLPTIALTSAFAVSQFIVILLSFKYGYVKCSRVEWFFFGLSIVCLILWIILTNRPDYLNAMNMNEHDADIILLSVNTLIEVMGAFAIFIKLYHHPGTEDSVSWLLGWISWLLALFAVDSFIYENVLYPLYLVVTNLAIWLLCFRESPQWRALWIARFMMRFSWESRTGLIYERIQK